VGGRAMADGAKGGDGFDGASGGVWWVAAPRRMALRAVTASAPADG
jgi:hypothetical protein